MPWSALVGDATLVDHPVTLHTPLSVLFLIAGNTNDLLVTRDEALATDWLLTNLAAEALFMPLFALVFVLLHASPEDILASVTAGSEVVVMAISTEETFVLGGERLINEGVTAIGAVKALLMPVSLLVGKVLGVSADGSLALFAAVSEEVLVALDAVGVLIAKDVTVSRQVQVTVEAAEMSAVPVLFHGFCVLARKDQAVMTKTSCVFFPLGCQVISR